MTRRRGTGNDAWCSRRAAAGARRAAATRAARSAQPQLLHAIFSARPHAAHPTCAAAINMTLPPHSADAAGFLAGLGALLWHRWPPFSSFHWIYASVCGCQSDLDLTSYCGVAPWAARAHSNLGATGLQPTSAHHATQRTPHHDAFHSNQGAGRPVSTVAKHSSMRAQHPTGAFPALALRDGTAPFLAQRARHVRLHAWGARHHLDPRRLL